MTALEAAKSRTVIPGVNAFGNWNWAQRLLRDLNATGEGVFTTVSVLPTGGGPSSGQSWTAVILAV